MMDSINNNRSELQRAGEVFRELMLPDLQQLRRDIVGDIATKLQRVTRPKTRHRPDVRKQAILRLIQEHPEITNLQICHAMDKHQDNSANYPPLPSWGCRLWQDAYHRHPNRVHAYISSIRRECH